MNREALDLIPPKVLIHPGTAENFGPIGRSFVSHIIDLAGLSPNHQVLEVGCGIGRMALPLTGYLSETGSYEGFDIIKGDIQWCQTNITPRCLNFRFRHADIANTKYNPEGGERAETFTFPYEDESFDLVFFASVFTHLLPLSFIRYLGESARVIRPGGRLFASFFLLNDESRELIAAGKSRNKFPHQFGECWVGRTDIPEAVVAYEETLVTDLYRDVGLEIMPPIHYGKWPGRERFLDGQDIIVATKPTSTPQSSTARSNGMELESGEKSKMNSVSSRNEIERQIVELGPWHLDVDVTPTLSTKAFLEALPGTYAEEGAKDPRYVSFVSPKLWWTHLIERVYPGGLEGRRFLDCACNCGGYCFWSKELGASECFGFDVRDHWIRQAAFLKENRIWPSDGIEFRKLDLYDLPSLSLDPFHLTLFSGIFYHLPDPITGLKAAADLTSELLVLSTEYRPGLPDGMLAANFESRAAVMSGVYELCWWPTGPKVLADVLRWLGFAESRVINWLVDSPRKRGRLTIAAARDMSILNRVQAIEEPTEMPRKPQVTRAGKRP